jgi:ABC-2 type transport system permease protein
MFAHIFGTRLKCLIRDKELVFWTLLFPLFLAVFFNMAFSNLISAETFRPVGVAVVNDAQYQQNTAFRSALKSVSEGSGRIFTLTETTKENADQLLNENKISGYLTVGTEIGMTVKKSDFEQSIIKSFVDRYLQTSSAAKSILTANPAAQSTLADTLKTQTEYTKDVSGGSASPNKTYNYFYTLIAMACLYGGFWGMKEVADIQANLSHRAARVNVAPVHKLKIFLSGMCASLLIQFVEVLALLAFLRFGLKIDFGPNAGLVVLTSFVGSVVGLTFGAFVGAATTKGEGFKTALVIGLTMLGSFLSGMMYQNMKYIVAQKAPALAYLNPANLLTDSFYALYYYSTYTRYALNMGILCAFILFFCAATYLIIRRQKYASL